MGVPFLSRKEERITVKESQVDNAGQRRCVNLTRCDVYRTMCLYTTACSTVYYTVQYITLD